MLQEFLKSIFLHHNIKFGEERRARVIARRPETIQVLHILNMRATHLSYLFLFICSAVFLK